MNIRLATAADLPEINRLIDTGHSVLGKYVAREWHAETQLSEAVLAHDFGEGESAANVILVAENSAEQALSKRAQLSGLVELQSLVGYQYCALSFSVSHILHRSDSLSVCHAQRLITLDQSLLGQGCISLCVIDAQGQAALICALLDAALTYASSHRALFPSSIYLALPGSEHFWLSLGEPLTGLTADSVHHSHAELLPQSPIYESFIHAGLQAALATHCEPLHGQTVELDANKPLPTVSPAAALDDCVRQWARQQGFAWQQKLYPIDGGLILQRVLP